MAVRRLRIFMFGPSSSDFSRNISLYFGVAMLGVIVACSSSGDEPDNAAVSRVLSSSSAPPGAEITVTLQPDGIGGFFAVQESIGDLEILSNTADSVRDGVFVQLEERAIDYTVRIPSTAQPGSTFVISGQFWSDPEARKPVLPGESVILVR